MTRSTITTPAGPAWADLDRPRSPAGLLVLGHGAGGSVEAPDLQAARTAALGMGWAAALVTQPYRAAGRRAAAPAPRLDEAWVAVVRALRRRPSLRGLPLVTGGRSSGARVACRTATVLGAHAVLCLAFPEHPPGRPDNSRLPELDAVTVPVLVVQGERDPFGVPPPSPTRVVHVVPGADHGLKRTAPIAAAVAALLSGVRD